MGKIACALGSALLAALLAAPLPAALAADAPGAQAGSQPPMEACRALLEESGLFHQPPGAQTVITRTDASTCTAGPVLVSAGRFVGWYIRQLTISGIVDAPATGAQHVQVRAQDTRMGATANPMLSYLMRYAPPFEVVLDYVNDSESKSLTLNEFTLRGEWLGLVQLSGAVSGLALPTDPLAHVDPDLPAALEFRSLTVRIDNRRFVQSMILSGVAGWVASQAADGDPGPAIQKGKLMAMAAVARFGPQVDASATTMEALTRFIADFPEPTGSFRCSLSAEPPVRISSDAAPDREQAAAMLRAAHPTCSYERAAPAQ